MDRVAQLYEVFLNAITEVNVQNSSGVEELDEVDRNYEAVKQDVKRMRSLATTALDAGNAFPMHRVAEMYEVFLKAISEHSSALSGERE